MGSIYLLFAGQYAAAKDVARTAVFGLIMGTVTASRHPRSDCCRNPCHCHHKSTAEGCS